MNTSSKTGTPGLEESLLVPQLLKDVSSRAPGWFLVALGLSVGSWFVQNPSNARSQPINITGFAEPGVSLPGELLPASFAFRARTALGRRLLEIRKRIVERGEPLLSWVDLEREIAARRGEKG
ncbi:MAG: hypothetical protein ABSH28_16820 [Acidobacteriota bacterium]